MGEVRIHMGSCAGQHQAESNSHALMFRAALTAWLAVSGIRVLGPGLAIM